MPKLLRPQEVAEILNVKRSTVDNWRSLGKGPAYVKLATGAIRYDEAELRNWVESQRVEAGAR